MAFLETPRFPDCISEGSVGGPRWAVNVVVSRSGFEQRTTPWANGRHEYNAAFGVRSLTDLEELKAFFLGVKGMIHAFRYKDWEDYKSCSVDQTPTAFDQDIADGDGLETQFQLVKNYKQSYAYVRSITKPVVGTVLISVDSIVQPSGWTVDTTTGIVTFDSPVAPGLKIQAGYEFDVPVRFNSELIQTQLEVYINGSTQVPLIEVRDIT